ncbi:hypothetical protein W824_15440 [Clavibacter cf. michiganensis LMG 26808]|nr:hypothetical protein W824_15440 [Clavibacter cf. michiganensis LMG 26808]
MRVHHGDPDTIPSARHRTADGGFVMNSLMRLERK